MNEVRQMDLIIIKALIKSNGGDYDETTKSWWNSPETTIDVDDDWRWTTSRNWYDTTRNWWYEKTKNWVDTTPKWDDEPSTVTTMDQQ